MQTDARTTYSCVRWGLHCCESGKQIGDRVNKHSLARYEEREGAEFSCHLDIHFQVMNSVALHIWTGFRVSPSVLSHLGLHLCINGWHRD